MTDEEKPAAGEEQPEQAAAEVKSSFDVFQDTTDQFFATANVNAVYSKPIRQGDTMVIPAAEVFSAFGFGIGEGSGVQGEQKGGGSGGGGGGQSFSRPVAVVICTPQGVSIQPVIDRSKLWMAALTAAGFMLATLSKMRRPPRGR
jgi:uncharacterized spore protein YtfJ